MGGQITRANVSNVIIQEGISNATYKWDVSVAQDKSIMAWCSSLSNATVYIGSNEGILANPDSSYLFAHVRRC